MAGTVSFFQKYRSQNFSDLVGQEIVVRSLSNALKNDTPSHAYLFCGPRGTGKTSTARILAKALNCENRHGFEPCNECSSCLNITKGSSLDVLELDAASNNGVDDIRELVERAQFAPAYSRYKVFIIDEVHMLSKAAFNALLKTLEEPPKHLVFVLATTDPQNLLPTVLSRCERYDFKRFTVAQMSERIKYVVSSEGMTIDDEAAELIAVAGDGSMRDALSELGAVASYGDGHISTDDVTRRLGLAGNERLFRLVDALLAQSINDALQVLGEIIDTGHDLSRLVKEFSEHLRRLMLIHYGADILANLDITERESNAYKTQASRFAKGQLFTWIKAILQLQEKASRGADLRLRWEMLLIDLVTLCSRDTLEGLNQRIASLEKRLGESGSNTALSQRAVPASQQSGFRPADQRPEQGNGVVPRPQNTGSAVNVREREYGASGAQRYNSGTATTAKERNAVMSSSNYAKQLSEKFNRRDGSTGQDSSVGTSTPVAPVSPVTDDVVAAKDDIAAESSGKDLGWGTTAPSVIQRPAQKKSAPVKAFGGAAQRAITVATPEVQASVSASWGMDNSKQTDKTAVATHSESVQPVVPLDSSNLSNLWREFMQFMQTIDEGSFIPYLKQVHRFELRDSNTLLAYLPKSAERDLQILIGGNPDINGYLQVFTQQRLKTVVFQAETAPKVAPVQKKVDFDGFVQYAMQLFEAQEV